MQQAQMFLQGFVVKRDHFSWLIHMQQIALFIQAELSGKISTSDLMDKFTHKNTDQLVS